MGSGEWASWGVWGVSRGMRVKEGKAKGKGKGKALVFYIPFTAAHNNNCFTGSTPKLQSDKEKALPHPTHPTLTCVVFSGMSRSMAMTLSYLYRELVSYCFRWRA